jgi:hypothetical protein
MERRRWSVQLALLLAVAIVAKSSAGGAMDHDVDPRDVRIKELEQRLDAYEGRRLGQASLRNAAPEDLAVRVAALEKLVDSVNVKAVDDKVRGGHPPSPPSSAEGLTGRHVRPRGSGAVHTRLCLGESKGGADAFSQTSHEFPCLAAYLNRHAGHDR